MEVREVRDPQAVELRRQASEPDRDLVEPHPPGLEPAPGCGTGGAHAGQAEQRRRNQASSFSSTGVIGTT